MSDINPVVLSHYDFSQRTCETEVVHPLANNAAPDKVFMLGTIASLPTNSVPALSNSLLARNNASYLSAGQIRLDQVGQSIRQEVTNPANLALAFAAPGLLTRARQVGTMAELSMASASGRVLVRGGATLMSAAGLAACEAAPEGHDYTSADAGTLPPDHDVTCENLYNSINNIPSDSTFQSLVTSLNLTSLNMDVKLYGNKVLADAKGNLIQSLKPKEVVAWQKEGNILFVLTRTQADTNEDGPAALFAYKLNADNSLASTEPLPTAFPGGKAVILPLTDPINMAGIEYNGGQWLGITFGADSSNIIYLVDPAVPANVNANQPYYPRIRPDECAIKEAGADAGTPDAGSRD